MPAPYVMLSPTHATLIESENALMENKHTDRSVKSSDFIFNWDKYQLKDLRSSSKLFLHPETGSSFPSNSNDTHPRKFASCMIFAIFL